MTPEVSARSRQEAAEAWSFSKPQQRVQWPYQRWYNAHIARRTRLGFVRELWDHSLADLAAGCRRREIADVLRRFGHREADSLMALLDTVDTQAKAAATCHRSDVKPAELIELLRWCYKRLPFGAQMRQLVDDEEANLGPCLDALKRHKLSFSLALLDAGRTRGGRARLAGQTGIAGDVLLDLVHRADMTRVALMSGGMVRAQWALGYRSLRDLQRADPDDYYERSDRHYRSAARGRPFDLTREACRRHIERMRQQMRIVC